MGRRNVMQNENFLETYIEECNEHLQSVDNDLVEMEGLGGKFDDGLINRVFRAAHSIKGGAGFFELETIKELSHRLENVLALMRAHTITPNSETVSLLLQGFDKLKLLLQQVDTANDSDISNELASLTALATSYLPSPQNSEALETQTFSIPGTSQKLEAGRLQIRTARDTGKGIALLRFDLIHDVQRLGKTPMEVLKKLEATGEVLDCLIDLAAVGTLDAEIVSADIPFYVLYSSPLPVIEISRTIELPTRAVTLLELPKPSMNPDKIKSPPLPPNKEILPETTTASACMTAEAADGAGYREGTTEGSIRIKTSAIDKLMNIVSELVLARNELMESLNGHEERTIVTAGRRIDVVTREMQEAVMLTRMQPIGNLFERYPRIVRDLAQELHKKIELSISGREVEVDKSILEGLSDPLTHLLRNACDHGIEAAESRIVAGKSPKGIVALRAKSEAGTIIVEIQDDGGGIDVEAVAAKALSLGLVTSEGLSRMSSKEKSTLILLPGLSTADRVTELSGRGVGMDVVKTNIDKLGGQLEIATTPGKGTSFKISLPLTLAIIPSLLVSVSGERYAIPQANIEEVLQIRPADSRNRIEQVGDRTVLVLRGSYIPLFRLADALGLPRQYNDPQTAHKIPDRRANLADRRSGKPPTDQGDDVRSGKERRYHATSNYSVVVVNSAALKYALVVDELYDTMEIVVRPLGSHFAKLREYSGATILGNGATALILDTTGLATRAGIASGETRETMAEGRETVESDETDLSGLLLFGNGKEERCALPLASVERVMRIKLESINHVGPCRFLPTEGQSLPIFALSDVLEVSDIMTSGGELVLVLACVGDKRLGILATPPVDSLVTKAEIDKASISKRGLLGSAVIKGKTTLIIDLEGFARAVKPEWFNSPRLEISRTCPSRLNT